MRNLVRREGDVRVLEQALREQIAESVILLVEGEDRSIWNALQSAVSTYLGTVSEQVLTSLVLDLDLLLALVEQEELESILAIEISFVANETVSLVDIALDRIRVVPDCLLGSSKMVRHGVDCRSGFRGCELVVVVLYAQS